MEVTFWGVRGSCAVPGSQTLRYGGNTSCISVRSASGTLLILDAGTGIRSLGNHLLQGEFGEGRGEAHLFLTHTHWDHIQGLPFFGPAYVPGNFFTIRGPRWPHLSLAQVLERATAPEFHPLPLTAMGARLMVQDLEEGERVELPGGVRVQATRLNHPAPALAYRVEADGGVFVYVTDTAPFQAPLMGPPSLWPQGEPEASILARGQEGLLRLLSDGDLLAFDTMFTAEEFVRFPDWGHGHPGPAIQLCHEAGVRHLLLFHHAPDRSDEQEDEALANARALAASMAPELRVGAAREGDVYRLGESRRIDS